MALTTIQPAEDLLNSDIRDLDFSIDSEGKTLQFYDDKLEKKVFNIHHYGDGKKIYFKKRKTSEKSNSFV